MGPVLLLLKTESSCGGNSPIQTWHEFWANSLKWQRSIPAATASSALRGRTAASQNVITRLRVRVRVGTILERRLKGFGGQKGQRECARCPLRQPIVAHRGSRPLRKLPTCPAAF